MDVNIPTNITDATVRRFIEELLKRLKALEDEVLLLKTQV